MCVYGCACASVCAFLAVSKWAWLCFGLVCVYEFTFAVLYYDSQSGRFPILSNESWPLGGSIVTTYIAFRSEDPDAHHFQPGRLCSTGTATPTAVSIPPPKPPAPSSVLSPHPSPRNGH